MDKELKEYLNKIKDLKDKGHEILVNLESPYVKANYSIKDIKADDICFEFIGNTSTVTIDDMFGLGFDDLTHRTPYVYHVDYGIEIRFKDDCKRVPTK